MQFTAVTHLFHAGFFLCQSPWPTKPMPSSKSLQSSLQLQELLWELLLGFFFNTKTRFYSVLGFFDSDTILVPLLTQWPQDLLCTGLGENPCGLQPKLFLSKVYKVTSSSSFRTWIIFLFSCFPLLWFLQIRKKPYSEITEKLCTSNFLCRLLRQFLNVHMELKQSISEQLMSYSTIKCSWLPAGNSCVLQYWYFRIHWEKLCLEKTMSLEKNSEVFLVTNNAGIKKSVKIFKLKDLWSSQIRSWQAYGWFHQSETKITPLLPCR